MSGRSSAPLFILGSERSGTNLLRVRLGACQNELAAPPPAHFLKYLYPVEPYLGAPGDEAALRQMVHMAVQLTEAHFTPWTPAIDEQRLFDAVMTMPAAQRNSVGVMHCAFEQHARTKGRASYICKDLNTSDAIDLVAQQIPRARFVYIHRDPRDVVASEIRRPLGSPRVHHAATTWREEQHRMLRALFSPEIASRSLRISYEDLIANEHETLSRVCAHGCLTMVDTAPRAAIEHDDGGNPDWANLARETLTRNAGKYRSELGCSDLRLVEGITWNQLVHLGYHPEHPTRPQVRARHILTDRLRAKARSLARKRERAAASVPERVRARQRLWSKWWGLVR